MNTVDSFLDGRIKVAQPIEGFRAGIDSIFLAAAVAAKPGDKVLDVGCGVGVSTLALAQKVAGVDITGIDVQDELVNLAKQNIVTNGFGENVKFITSDIQAKTIQGIEPNSFDHVITNPPYYEAGNHRSSPNAIKAIANSQIGISIEDWVGFCVKMLKPGGTVTIINRPESCCHLSCIMRDKVGDFRVFPLWPGNGKPAKRVLLKGKKGSKGEMQLLPGMVLHEGDEKYSPLADSVLRGNSQIIW